MSHRSIIHAALFTPISKGRWGLPLLFWGEPGVAKTSVIEEAGASAGLPVVTLSPGEMGEGAFGVVPVPDGRVLRYPPPEWVETVADGGIVFVDEISSTPPALQPPLLGLFFSRRIGGTTLHPRVRLLAAANPPEIAAAGYDLAPPVANRCGHMEWATPSVAEHTAYMQRGDASSMASPRVDFAAGEEARVRAAWPTAWARAVGLETAFLSRVESAKNGCPKATDARAGRAWPSDRTWEMATRALASAQVHGLSETERDAFIAAFIGEARAAEWITYMARVDLPDPALLLDGKVEFKHATARIDRTAAVLSACTALVAPKSAERREVRVSALWRLMERVLKEDKLSKDMLVPTAVTLTKEGLTGVAAAKPVIVALYDVLSAAGV